MSEQKYGKDMHYPAYHVAARRLKHWAAMAKTPEERRAYLADFRKKGKAK